MSFVSTRNTNNTVSSLEAVLQGLASDGGLFVPEIIHELDGGLSKLETLSSLSYEELTVVILSSLLPDYDESEIKECVFEGYKGKFDIDTLVGIKEISDAYFLELYHGPTSAFKDMALCILPRLLCTASRKLGSTDDIVILTATSGDTGKAALEGFSNVPGTKIFVFYPKDGVSSIQELQMRTQKGSNVHVCGINGNFDDAQTAVKKAFGNLSIPGIRFSSANSINIGRLAPQVAYYFYSYLDLARKGKLRIGDAIDFVVPTGNFGDILAGWIAKKMGLPVRKLCCASNKNNILYDFFKTGVYDTKRDFYLTASPSMDILVSSNLERLLFYALGCDGEYIKKLMDDLSNTGRFEVSKDVLKKLNEEFDVSYATDEECFDVIKATFEKERYLLDTHTAVAYACKKKVYGDKKAIVLSTANPYKFSGDIIKALKGEKLDGFDAMDALYEYTKILPPRDLNNLRSKSIIHNSVCDPANIEEYIKEELNAK